MQLKKYGRGDIQAELPIDPIGKFRKTDGIEPVFADILIPVDILGVDFYNIGSDGEDIFAEGGKKVCFTDTGIRAVEPGMIRFTDQCPPDLSAVSRCHHPPVVA